MVKKNHVAARKSSDNLYKRMAVLVAALVLIAGAYFAISTAVRAINGHERKLMTAFIETFKQPHVGGEFTLSQQAQTSVLSAQGTFGIKDGSSAAANATIEGTLQGKKVKVPLQLYGNLSDKEGFIRVSDSEGVVDLVNGIAPDFKNDVETILQKINNKWLRLEASDKKVEDCATTLIAKVFNDQEAAKALEVVYKSSSFVVVDKVTKRDARQEYAISIDKDKVTGFIKNLKASKVFQDTKGCDATFDPLGTEAAAANTTSQQPSIAQQLSTPQSDSNATKIIVENGKVVEIVTASSTNAQMNSSRVTFNTKPLSVNKPTADIIEYEEVKPHVVSIGNIITEQAQAAQSQTPSN